MIRAGTTAAMVSLLAGSGAAQNADLVNPDASFPEGPLWHEGELYYVEYGADRVMRFDGNRNHEVWRQEGCGPSGLVDGGGGNLLVTCYDADTLVRISPAGETVETIEATTDGAHFTGPNDAVRDAAGGVYFTASGVWDVAAPIDGRILHLAPDGTIRELANDIHYANGLALSPDGSTLYVSEMAAQRVLKFPLEADGSLGPRFLFARLEDLAPNPEGGDIYMGPDGLETDSQGNVYIAHFEGGRILVASPEGELIRILDVPAAYVTNLALGPDERTVYVTAARDAWTAPYPGTVFRVENR